MGVVCVSRFGGSPSPPPPGRPPCVLQSFKDFLLCLDPAVGEMEAVRRYTDYKMAFRRQQMEAFFLAHREEEWCVRDNGGANRKSKPHLL